MTDWQLQDAKKRLGEVVRRAQVHGPQTVTVRGTPAAIILSVADYAALSPAKPSFTRFLLEGPAWPEDVLDSIEDHSRDTGRNCEC